MKIGYKSNFAGASCILYFKAKRISEVELCGCYTRTGLFVVPKSKLRTVPCLGSQQYVINLTIYTDQEPIYFLIKCYLLSMVQTYI
ncbi:hypothetical protein HOLleu_04119 [Holothuria leucospilota]|uniref:Uncharacterized protein n=1 Tax=Holothuria leucospilota TaxID=206669 RepID=A0A9Q1HI16_HOLLE|nr:hypothetical protein HOLleu_04119 [Holothuria leucospilota]